MLFRRKTMVVIVSLLLAYGGLIVFLAMNQRSFIYFPDPNHPLRAPWGAGDMEVVQAQTEDGLRLEGWYKAPRDGKPVIVVFHGNASHQGMSAQKVRPFLDAGYGALLAAYRGYGGNPGKPTEEGLYADGRAFLRWLEAERDVPEKDIVIYGESLGTGVASRMAAEDFPGVRGLILESPYTNFVDMARRQYFFVPFLSRLVKDRYDTLSRIGAVCAPVLVISGGRDIVVPLKMGRTVFAAARAPKTMMEIPAAGHNDLYLYGAFRGVLDFLKTLEIK